MKINVYENKIAELDKEYEVLKSAISKNRNDRDVWQKLIDDLDIHKNEFPIQAKRDKQIVYILKNVFKRGVTMSQLEDKYTELNKEHKKLANVMRRLKDEGVLISMRFNKQNKMTFWGLTEWVIGDNFLKEFNPLEKELPFKISIIEKL